MVVIHLLRMCSLSIWTLYFDETDPDDFTAEHCLGEPCALTYAEVWVIVNQHNQVDAMDKSEVTGLYLGRYLSFRDGSAAHPLDQDKDGSVYEKTFYQRLTGKSAAYINAYWAQILFTGRA